MSFRAFRGHSIAAFRVIRSSPRPTALIAYEIKDANLAALQGLADLQYLDLTVGRQLPGAAAADKMGRAQPKNGSFPALQTKKHRVLL